MGRCNDAQRSDRGVTGSKIVEKHVHCAANRNRGGYRHEFSTTIDFFFLEPVEAVCRYYYFLS